MRTIWRGVVRTVFWSYERGTWPYDIAVALIVLFVLFSPRSWFQDRPTEAASPAASVVELRSADQPAGIAVYRVDARLLAPPPSTPRPELEKRLHEAVRKNVAHLNEVPFRIVGVEPVRGSDGSVAYYDVVIQP